MKLGRILLALVCFISTSWSNAEEKFSAFGVDEGIKLIDNDYGIVNTQGMTGTVLGANSVILYQVPKGIPQALVYEALYTEETGVCAIGAYIRDIDSLHKLRQILDSKYGKSIRVGYSTIGEFSLQLWNRNKNPKLPDNLFAIEIIESTYDGYVVPVLLYYYQNFIKCNEIIDNTLEDIL